MVRVYAMYLRDRQWTLTRDQPDFSPLPFSQRFTGTVALDGNRIDGAWEKTTADQTWEHDFELAYVRTGS